MKLKTIFLLFCGGRGLLIHPFTDTIKTEVTERSLKFTLTQGLA